MSEGVRSRGSGCAFAIVWQLCADRVSFGRLRAERCREAAERTSGRECGDSGGLGVWCSRGGARCSGTTTCRGCSRGGGRRWFRKRGWRVGSRLVPFVGFRNVRNAGRCGPAENFLVRTFVRSSFGAEAKPTTVRILRLRLAVRDPGGLRTFLMLVKLLAEHALPGNSAMCHNRLERWRSQNGFATWRCSLVEITTNWRPSPLSSKGVSKAKV